MSQEQEQSQLYIPSQSSRRPHSNACHSSSKCDSDFTLPQSNEHENELYLPETNGNKQ